MDHNFAILMFIFAAALLLYAALLAITKNYNMLPYRSRISVQPKNSKKYTYQLAKVVALVAVGVAIGAAVSLWNFWLGLILIIAGVIGACWAGTHIVKDQ